MYLVMCWSQNRAKERKVIAGGVDEVEGEGEERERGLAEMGDLSVTYRYLL